MTSRAAAIVLATLVGVLGACARPTPPPADPAPPTTVLAPLPDTRLVVVPVGTDAPQTALPVVFVEVVATTAERQRGLSGRETLPQGRGMLFVYPSDRARTFWMKDCLIGLDIAFLDASGHIVQVATLPPGAGLFGQDVPAVTCETPVRYVLEVAALRLGHIGVGTGDLVDLRTAVDGVVAE